MRYLALLILSAGLLCAQQLEKTSLSSAEPVMVTPDGTLVAVERVGCSLIRPCSRYLVYLFAPGVQFPVIRDLGGISDEKPVFMRRDARGRIWAGGVNPDGSPWLTNLDNLRRLLPSDLPSGQLLDLAFDADSQPVLLLRTSTTEADAGARLVKLDRDSGRMTGRFDFGSGVATPVALANGPNGDLYLAGITNARNFPATAGAYQTTSFSAPGWPLPFIARIAGDLSRVKAATLLGGAAAAFPQTLAMGSDGSVYVGGEVYRILGETIFPTTPEAWQRTVTDIAPTLSVGLGPMPAAYPPMAGFISRLDSTLSQLLDSTLLAGESSDTVRALNIDAAGRVIATGSTDSLRFPATGAFRTQCGPDRGPRLNNGAFITRLDARLRTVEASSPLTGLAITNGPAVYPDGSASLMLDRAAHWWPDRQPETSITCLMGMDYRPAVTVARGQLLTLFGEGFSPTPLQDFSSQTEFPLSVDGVTVSYGTSLGELPAPILAMTPHQVNVILPQGDGTIGALTLTVRKDGKVIDRRILNTTERLPTALLRVTGDGRLVPGRFRETSSLALADVLNEDGERNSAEHPARPGSVVTLFTSGMGHLLPSVDERKPAPETPARPSFPFMVAATGRLIQPDDVSTIPGRPAGVVQMRFHIPDDFAGSELVFGLAAQGAGPAYFLYVAR